MAMGDPIIPSSTLPSGYSVDLKYIFLIVWNGTRNGGAAAARAWRKS